MTSQLTLEWITDARAGWTTAMDLINRHSLLSLRVAHGFRTGQIFEISETVYHYIRTVETIACDVERGTIVSKLIAEGKVTAVVKVGGRYFCITLPDNSPESAIAVMQAIARDLKARSAFTQPHFSRTKSLEIPEILSAVT